MENKEMRMFYDWSTRHEGRYKYIEEDKNIESYFIKRGRDEYITEYDFDTIVKLRAELGNMWKGDVLMEEIMKSVTVSAMKNYKRNVMEKGKKDELDEFIYIF